MAITAQLADGTTLQFPDGTPDDVVEKTVKAHVAEQPSRLGSGWRGLERGLTFGFADEIDAAQNALRQGVHNLFNRPTQSEQVSGRPTMGQAYDKGLELARGEAQQDRETNPVSSFVGEAAGGVGSGLALGLVAAPLAAAARAAPYVAPVLGAINRFAAPVAERLPAWVSSLSTPAKLAGAGGAQAGVAGFGEGEGGLPERLESGAIGAGTGAVVGPVVGGLVGATGGVVGRATHALGLRDSQAAADRIIGRGLDRAGLTTEDVESRLARAGGQPLAMVDVGGRNVTNLGAVAANTPSKAMDVADQFVESRRMMRPDRLTTAGEAAFGGGGGTDIAENTAALKAQRSSEARPLYEAAFGRPAGMTDAMGHILEDPIAQQGLKQGLEIQRIENATRRARGEPEVPTHDPAIKFDDDGTPRIEGVPNMRSLDAVKRGMDAIFESQRDPVTGLVPKTERNNAIDQMRRTWVQLLDQNNPDYAAARAAWGGPSAQMEATAAGRSALRTDRDIVADRMKRGTPDVQDAYRLGAGRDFADRVSNPAKATGVARTMLEDSQMQARLASLLPQDLHATFNTALRREAAMQDVEKAVSPRAGSQTARLIAGGTDMANAPVGPWITAFRQLVSGHPFQAGGTLGEDVVRRRIGQGINPATADALAERLFATDPQLRLKIIQAVRERSEKDAARTATARAIIRPAVRGVGQAVGMANARDNYPPNRFAP